MDTNQQKRLKKYALDYAFGTSLANKFKYIIFFKLINLQQILELVNIKICLPTKNKIDGCVL